METKKKRPKVPHKKTKIKFLRNSKTKTRKELLEGNWKIKNTSFKCDSLVMSSSKGEAEDVNNPVIWERGLSFGRDRKKMCSLLWLNVMFVKKKKRLKLWLCLGCYSLCLRLYLRGFGLTYPLPILERIWTDISINFIEG